LIRAAADQLQLTRTMGVGGDRDQYSCGSSLSSGISTYIKPVGTRIDFQKTTVSTRVRDHPVLVDLIARTLEQQPAGCVTENIAVSIARRSRSVCAFPPSAKREWMEQTL